MSPPLAGIKVVEFAGLAPGPFVGMVLADFGADVVRVDAPPSVGSPAGTINLDTLARRKRSVALSPKTPQGLKILKQLIAQSDVLIDPFRPGVMERLGLGPDVFLSSNGGLNANLVYARITGFQRQGPYAAMAGHDINYLALSGVLSLLGTRQYRPQTSGDKTFWRADTPPPSPPNFLMGDFAGGAMMCILGILMALVVRAKKESGGGQVVEADMVSGVRYLSTFLLQTSHRVGDIPENGGAIFGDPSEPLGHTRGTGLLEGEAPWYAVYKAQDGFMSVGALEPKFYATMMTLMKEAEPALTNKHAGPALSPTNQRDRSHWPELRSYLAEAFARRTRAGWSQVFLGSDACVVPVLTRDEANGVSPFPSLNSGQAPQGVLPFVPQDSSDLLKDEDRPVPPAASPNLTCTPALTVPGSAPALSQSPDFPQLLLPVGQDTEDVLEEWLGLGSDQISAIVSAQAKL